MGLVNGEPLVHFLMKHFYENFDITFIGNIKGYQFFFLIKTFYNSSLPNALRASIKFSFC